MAGHKDLVKSFGVESSMNYTDYIELQKSKTSDPKRRKSWLGIEWIPITNTFRGIFEGHKDILEKCENALCLGARTGQEVQALRDMGIDAIGIDLVPCKPLVIEGDVHDIPFPDNNFDFIFSNIYDHVLYPKKFISEIKRVLRPKGYALIHFAIGDLDKWAVTEVKDIKKIIPLFIDFKIILNKKISIPNYNFYNWEILIK